MRIDRIKLKNFRNYRQQDYQFSRSITLIVGPNASGKTNLLEAIRLLSIGRGFKAKTEKEMIAYDGQITRVKGLVTPENEPEKLEIVITAGRINNQKVPKKKYLVNDVSRRRFNFTGIFTSVLFRPEDLEIVLGSPAVRRGYLDDVLEQVDHQYRRACLSYRKGLRQRNKLLEQIREEGKPRSILFFWDKLLIENGNLITKKRQEFIDFVNGRPALFGQLGVIYDQSQISPQRLEKYAEAEVAAGMTLVGPHRDDIRLEGRIDEPAGERGARDLSIYGSRGEQRLAVLSLKLAELAYLAEVLKQRPVLLLDDIFSELDEEHCRAVLKVVPEQQTLITTTDLRFFRDFSGKYDVLRLPPGSPEG